MQSIEAWCRRCVRWIKQQEHNETYKYEWSSRDAEQIAALLQKYNISDTDSIEKALQTLNDNCHNDLKCKSSYHCLNVIFDSYKAQLLRCADEAFTKIVNRGDPTVRISFFSTITFLNIYDNPLYNEYCTTPMGKNEKLMTQIATFLINNNALQTNNVCCPDSYCVQKMFDQLIAQCKNFDTIYQYSLRSKTKLKALNDTIIPECLVASKEMKQWQIDIIVNNDELKNPNIDRIVCTRLTKWIDSWSTYICQHEKNDVVDRLNDELKQVELDFTRERNTTKLQTMAKEYTKNQQILHSSISMHTMMRSIRQHLKTLQIHCSHHAVEMCELITKAQAQCVQLPDNTDAYEFKPFLEHLETAYDEATHFDCNKHQFTVLRQLKADVTQRGVLTTIRNKWRDNMLQTLKDSKSTVNQLIDLQFCRQLEDELESNKYIDQSVTEIPRLWQKTFELIMTQADQCKDKLTKSIELPNTIELKVDQDFTLPQEWIQWLKQINSYFEQHIPVQFSDMCNILKGYLTNSKIDSTNAIEVV
jgi:hypothetical protein